jgi:hypothetical protein
LPVILATSQGLPDAGRYDAWIAIGTAQPLPEAAREMTGAADALEEAYDAIAGDWQQIARRLGGDRTAGLSHTPSCAANVSDFGLMLAWSKLVGERAREPQRLLVICDDPWLFRHLASLPGIDASSSPPPLWPERLRLKIRGFLSRSRFALRVLAAALGLRHVRRRFPRQAVTILAYGHPASDAEGSDGYFGPLMTEVPALFRVLHADCPVARARVLMEDQRSFSLHAWGSIWAALGLPWARWRPSIAANDPNAWLIRRAAELEAGTGQAAALRWQQICQRAWLAETKPKLVVWPWENHAWERDLVRAARSRGVMSLGYQHTTVAHREWNYAPASNADGLASIPDRILVNGPAAKTALRSLNCPEDRMEDVGALRLKIVRPLTYDPQGPVFVALPFDGAIARQMIEAILPLGAKGRRFLVKDHPMVPFPFAPAPGVEATATGLDRQEGLAAVLYAATTVGLEAVLAGLPTLRFRPRGKIPADVIPAGLQVPTAAAETLETALGALSQPPRVAPESIFTPPRFERWREIIANAA